MKKLTLSAGMLVLITLFAACTNNKSLPLRVQTSTVKVDSLHQILLVTTDTLVKPVLYSHISGLEKLPVPKAKAMFVSAVLPAVLVARLQVEESKKKLTEMNKHKTWKSIDSTFYLDMKMRYKAKDMNDLLSRMITLPNSIVLAQASVESGWGQSRFFLEGNNLFGIWSFNKFEPRIEAAKTRNKKKIYLRSYDHMAESIVHYFEILGKASAYKNLRIAANETEDPYKLLPLLGNFSERRDAYTLQLKKVIDRNNFTQYDRYQIDPTYITTADN